MKLGFSINAFAGEKFKPFPNKALKIISDAGFKNVELVFDKPYFWLQDLALDRVEEIKTFLKEYNLQVVSVSACTAGGYERPDSDVAPPGQRFGPSFADLDKSKRELRVAHVKKVIDFAIMLNCDNINTSTGYQPYNRSIQDTWSDVRDCYREVVKYAQSRDVWVNIEYEPGEYGPGGIFIANAKDTLKMIKDVGMANLGVNLDLGHAKVCGELIPFVIETFGVRKLLRHIHIEDIKGNRHFHEVPGDGNMDFKQIFDTLSLDVDYTGCVTVELYSQWDKDPEDACRRSYQYLMSNFSNFFEN